MAEEQHPEFEYTDLLPLLSDPYETTEFKYLGNLQTNMKAQMISFQIMIFPTKN